VAEKNISSVRIVIREFLSKTRNINESNVWEWFSSFRETLAYQEYSEQKNEYAEHLLADANNYIALCYVQGIEGAMAKTMEKTELCYKAVHDACCEKYGDEYISAKAKEKSYLADHPGTETIWTKKYRKFIDGAEGEQKSPSKTKALPKGAKETAPATTNQAQPVAQKAAVKNPDQLVWGKFENVFLTQEQHDDFCVHVGNVNEANKIIDSLSCKLEDGSFNSSNHYATLMHWSNYRKEKAAEAVETAKARAAANAEAFGNVDRRTPYQKNQDELHQLYVMTSEKLKELK
jgi:hypothetical protein